MKSRLQKLIAESGLCSRRKAEALISEGRVRVNGKVARLGDSADPDADKITADGKAISAEAKAYFLLNKPKGYECTLDSTTGKPLAVELVDTRLRVFTVGRLDAESRGLVIVTNDGDFANLVGHPSSGIEKEYRVKVRAAVPDDVIERLAAGVEIDGRMTRPCKVEALSRNRTMTVLRFVLHEGRKRQIRRMLEAVGLQAADLERARIGPISAGRLPEGRSRPLTAREVAALRAAAGGGRE